MYDNVYIYLRMTNAKPHDFYHRQPHLPSFHCFFIFCFHLKRKPWRCNHMTHISFHWFSLAKPNSLIMYIYYCNLNKPTGVNVFLCDWNIVFFKVTNKSSGNDLVVKYLMTICKFAFFLNSLFTKNTILSV